MSKWRPNNQFSFRVISITAKTKQNKTKQNETKQNKTKQNKTKKNTFPKEFVNEILLKLEDHEY